MYIYRYCNNCHKILSLTAENFYARYNPETKKHKGYFICPHCRKYSENRMPAALVKEELLQMFRNFQIVKDLSDCNQSTLYPIYWVIYKNDDYITCYGTCNEEDFFNIIK